MANPDQCAVNPDGTLKDASEIIFYDSEGNDQPIPMHSIINPTSSQDQTSRAARGANSQQDNLAASGAAPARKVAGTCQHKLAWKLTTDENAASTSTGGQKRKRPEQAPTTAKQPKAANSTARRRSNTITLSDDEDDTQAHWNKATAHHGSGNNNGEDEDSDGKEAEGDYEDIQAERALDTKMCGAYSPQKSSGRLAMAQNLMGIGVKFVEVSRNVQNLNAGSAVVFQPFTSTSQGTGLRMGRSIL
ncbi:hypothetical protein BDN67DRAFT_1017574 [Paxillus ammoniavirescens]|nr:hypothetical protein BDN67DRAFT_1017574 [Paxillus ammoniavirescens]